MGKLHNNEKGFGIVEIILGIAILALIGFVGWYVYTNNMAANSPTTATTPTVDPYAGWKTATSTRAKFSIKYPAGWTYSETIGDRDAVEHITIDSKAFHITVDSFNAANRLTADGNEVLFTKCNDCKNTTKTEAFTAGKLGLVNLETITYTLDGGMGNALVLRQADGTYYITSPTATDIKSDFRGASKLDSLQAYQNETASQFAANTDLVTAKLILKSVSY